MAHFYLNEAIESARPGVTVQIDGAEVRHAVTVSRVAVGDELTVGNGRGLFITGTVTRADHTALELTAETVREVEAARPAIILVQALAKGDRDEMAVQAATELGIDAVIPWTAARSISRWEGAKVPKGIARWSAIVREASKQSVRAWVPDVLELVTTKQLAKLAAATQMLILDPEADRALSSLEFVLGHEQQDITLVVGPEGGIASHEFEALVAAGATRVKLGDTVLRTSTAGPAAIAVLSAKLGRW
jgi:16S rRNA (uracil1498-N3)-methyltransferase